MANWVKISLFITWILLSAASHSKCKLSDFEVINFNYKVADTCKVTPCPIYMITGELKNNCHEESGVEIRITGRGTSNQVIDTTTGWPASIRNIHSGNTEPFNFGSLFTYDPEIKTFDIDIISVKQW